MFRPRKSAGKNAQIQAQDYPALRAFLRGYFHQDMKDEYGSAEAAARQFCADANAEELAAVGREWKELTQRPCPLDLDALNRDLTGPLGSSWTLSTEEVQQLGRLFLGYSV